MTRAEYEACQARDENGFRAAIETLTRRGLQTGLANVDYKVLVADEWRRGNIDDVIDREVDRAIGEVRDESSWFKLWSSLASREKAAGACHHRRRAGLPLRADEEGHRGLATGLGKEIGKRIELATVDTAGPATQCMQAFLGRRYGTTVARIVADGAGKEYSIDPARAGPMSRPAEVLMEGGEGIAGTVVLVVRRQLANMASRIGQRIVGSILEPPGVGGGERRRHRPHCQGHLGLPPRRAAHRRRRDEGQGDQGQGARGAGQVDRQSRSATASRRSPRRPPSAWSRSGSSSAAPTPRWWSSPSGRTTSSASSRR